MMYILIISVLICIGLCAYCLSTRVKKSSYDIDDRLDDMDRDIYSLEIDMKSLNNLEVIKSEKARLSEAVRKQMLGMGAEGYYGLPHGYKKDIKLWDDEFFRLGFIKIKDEPDEVIFNRYHNRCEQRIRFVYKDYWKCFPEERTACEKIPTFTEETVEPSFNRMHFNDKEESITFNRIINGKLKELTRDDAIYGVKKDG